MLLNKFAFSFFSVLAVGRRDIIFLIDSTMGSILVNTAREFIKRFVETMPIGPNQVQVGVAQFSDTPKIEMELNSHGSRDSLVAALGQIKPKPGQYVNIGTALDFVRVNMLRTEKGSRIHQGIPQIVLLLTGKKSNDRVEQPARALHRMGVLTMAVGVKAADGEELRQIAFSENVAFLPRDLRLILRNPLQRQMVDALSTLAGTVVTETPTAPGNDMNILSQVSHQKWNCCMNACYKRVKDYYST